MMTAGDDDDDGNQCTVVLLKGERGPEEDVRRDPALEVAIREGVEDVNHLLGCLDRQPRPAEPLGHDYIKELDLDK